MVFALRHGSERLRITRLQKTKSVTQNLISTRLTRVEVEHPFLSSSSFFPVGGQQKIQSCNQTWCFIIASRDREVAMADIVPLRKLPPI
jgi:hypothetical protein